MIKVIIDRFEGEFAVCEAEKGKMINIEKFRLPANAKEGDVLIVSPDKSEIDEEETKKRKKRIEELMRDLWK